MTELQTTPSIVLHKKRSLITRIAFAFDSELLSRCLLFVRPSAVRPRYFKVHPLEFRSASAAVQVLVLVLVGVKGR